MAKVIHRLWVDGNQDALILPGNLPLDDAGVRNEMIYYLPQGWDPVVEADIDGERSETVEIEKSDARFGSVQACRRLARTIFLGSAPTTASQTNRGIDAEHTILGALQPGQGVGIYKDALRRLGDRLHYLNSANSRLWFDVRPNLRREMEDRKRRFNTKEHLLPEIQSRLRGLVGSLRGIGVHVFNESRDVPDDWNLHLVILATATPFSRNGTSAAVKAAQELLEKRGDQPRIKRNRLLFLGADSDSIARLEDLICTFKAWESITSDVQDKALNLDTFQSAQAQRNRESASDAANRGIRETYKWLLAPIEEPDGKGGILPMRWEHFALNTGSASLSQDLERILKENELVIEQWAPVHLDGLLRAWFWKDGVAEVPALEVWQKTCQYLYMPRLKESNVFATTVAEGAASRDFFGLAQGKRDGKFQAFSFGTRTATHLESNLLIEPSAAEAYEAEKRAREIAATPATTTQFPPGSIDRSATSAGPTPNSGTTAKDPKTRFYGTVALNPLLGKKEFADIVDEIVQQFTTKVGTTVHISVEIQAQSPTGFDETVQRTVKENCNSLHFSSFDFEAGE